MQDRLSKLLESIKGLSDEEVELSRKANGVNELTEKKKKPLILKILEIFKEPMFLLLILASSVYFIVGEYADGIIMLICVLAICFIEFFQEAKTDKALEELNRGV